MKSERIVPNKPRPEILPLPLQKKIQRYLFFWRKEFGDAWLPLSRTQLNEEPKPGLMERVADALLFRLLRTLDQVVALIYCFAPLSLLKRYRAIKSHSREAVAKDCVE